MLVILRHLVWSQSQFFFLVGTHEFKLVCMARIYTVMFRVDIRMYVSLLSNVGLA